MVKRGNEGTNKMHEGNCFFLKIPVRNGSGARNGAK